MVFGFLLKKTIAFFIEPLGMILTLCVLGLAYLYANRIQKSKRFFLLAFGALLGFSYPPFSNFLVAHLEQTYPKFTYKHPVKYIHVLGYGHNTDRHQPLSSQISNGGTKRVLEGVILHRNIPGSQILFTGYKGSTSVPNAVMNAKLAQALGVASQDIIINGKPHDTLEETYFSKQVIGDAPFVLVTSAMHMPRAMHLFSSLGMHPIAAPTDFHSQTFKSYWVAPRIIALQNSSLAIHEYIGILWMTLQEQIAKLFPIK